LEKSFATQVAEDWAKLPLTLPFAEQAILSYTEKSTLDEASMQRRDVDMLRSTGFAENDVLIIATAIAYHNYSLRMAAETTLKLKGQGDCIKETCK
jgi:hypothetical protein